MRKNDETPQEELAEEKPEANQIEEHEFDPDLRDNEAQKAGEKAAKEAQDAYQRLLKSTRIFLIENIRLLKFKEVRELLLTLEDADIARVIAQMPDSEKIITFRFLPTTRAVEVFSYFEPSEQEEFLQNFTNEEARDILENMDPDDRTDLFEELPAIIVKRLLRLLSPEERKIATQLLNYKEDTAGRIMTPDYVSLEEDMTAAEALNVIKNEAGEKETIYTCYVVDKKGRLTGVLSLRDILVARSGKKIADIMGTDPIRAYTYQDQQEVARSIKKYDFLAIPVVDHSERLVGIVTVDDIFDVLEEENTEDFQLIAAVQPTDEGYLRSPFWKLLFNRSIWIVILLFVGSISQDIIKGYQNGMESSIYLSLSLFFTMLIGVGGNIGSQSSILVIRGLATGEITRSDTWRLLLRSLLMGLAMGAILAGFMLLRIVIFHTGEEVKWMVTAALAVLVTIANFLGVVLPLLIKRIGIDPALISSPLITTLIDVGGLVLYFEVAKLVMRWVYGV